MTKKELSQYYWLQREIEADEARLKALDEKATSPRSQQITGMPRGGSGEQDKIGELVAEMADLQAIIAAKQIQCIHERQRIERFILSIPDSMTRLVFTYRCIDGMSWRDVASAMGYRMSEENARQTYHRYLKSINGEEKR